MLTKKVTITNETGLHARPASEFVKTAKQFKSEISVSLVDKKVNAKSLIHLLTLGADQGATIEIHADGTDEEAAIEALIKSLNSGTDK
ncbi:MAG: HPr family phosphocarrier protein [Chloroflexota bacterium]